MTPRKRKNRVCALCSARFTSKRSNADYCSNACRQAAYRAVKTRKSGRYFTGKPCRHGHVAERYASNNVCVVCARDRVAKKSIK
jgi:hypothetical protein